MVETGGAQREAALRVAVDDERDAPALPRIDREGGGIVGEDRDGAVRYRVTGKAATVGRRPLQGGEQKTGPDLAGIGAEADDLGIGVDGGGRTRQLSKLQSACPACSRSPTL